MKKLISALEESILYVVHGRMLFPSGTSVVSANLFTSGLVTFVCSNKYFSSPSCSTSSRCCENRYTRILISLYCCCVSIHVCVNNNNVSVVIFVAKRRLRLSIAKFFIALTLQLNMYRFIVTAGRTSDCFR